MGNGKTLNKPMGNGKGKKLVGNGKGTKSDGKGTITYGKMKKKEKE